MKWYTRRCSLFSKQYPNNLTKFGCESLPRKSTSDCNSLWIIIHRSMDLWCGKLKYTYLPFLKTLHALTVQFFDNHDYAGAALRWCQIPPIDPCFVDFSKPTFSEETVRSEGLGCGFQFHIAEISEDGRWKDSSVWRFFFHAVLD